VSLFTFREEQTDGEGRQPMSTISEAVIAKETALVEPIQVTFLMTHTVAQSAIPSAALPH
jgi:hypothetical protein